MHGLVCAPHHTHTHTQTHPTGQLPGRPDAVQRPDKAKCPPDEGCLWFAAAAAPEPQPQGSVLSLQECMQFSEHSRVFLKAEELVPPIGRLPGDRWGQATKPFSDSPCKGSGCRPTVSAALCSSSCVMHGCRECSVGVCRSARSSWVMGCPQRRGRMAVPLSRSASIGSSGVCFHRQQTAEPGWFRREFRLWVTPMNQMDWR